MKRILLTGMSGTGKSVLVEELARRGFPAVDLDSPDWSEHAPDGDWVWQEERVRTLLDAEGPLGQGGGRASDGPNTRDTPDSEAADWLFVSGCAENQVGFHPRFDAIVLLSAPTDVVLHRLATRTNNDYGKHPEEVADVLGYIDTVEPRLRRVAHHEVDTSAPLDAVVARVLELVGAPERPPAD